MLDKKKTEEKLLKILEDDIGASYTPIEWMNEEWIKKHPEDKDELWCRFCVDNLSDDTLRKLLKDFIVYLCPPDKQPPLEDRDDENHTFFEVQITEK